MGRFNKNAAVALQTPTVPNLAGGKGFSLKAEEELASIMMTSFLGDQCYRTSNEVTKRIFELLPECDPQYVAKLTLYVRNEIGLRSVTHLVGAWIAKNYKNDKGIKGVRQNVPYPWLKKFFISLFHRPDDMLEIVAALGAVKPFPNVLKKAIRHTLENIKPHTLAKYKAADKEVKMVDLIRLCEPNFAKNDCLRQLSAGELKLTGTWESDISAAGGDEDETEEAWGNLLLKNKLRYLALIRNVRNIVTKAPDHVGLLIQRLQDLDEMRKSLIMPHQVYTALQIAKGLGHRELILTLNKVLDASVDNIPDLPGNTLIAVDLSGSMHTAFLPGVTKPKPTDLSCAQVASIFAAAYFKKNNSQVMVFADSAKYLTLNPGDTVDSLAFTISHSHNGGTDFTSITAALDLKKHIDRLFIFSDMQAWVEHDNTSWFAGRPRTFPVTWSNACKIMGNTPKCYTVDLHGYGTTQLPNKDTVRLYGFSDKMFNFIHAIEHYGSDGMVKAIKSGGKLV